MARPSRRLLSISAVVVLLLVSWAAPGGQSRPATTTERLMTAQELATLPTRPPDYRISYGKGASQYGELRIPAGTGPHPLVVLIHGGCFKAAYATAQLLRGDGRRPQGRRDCDVEHRIPAARENPAAGGPARTSMSGGPSTTSAPSRVSTISISAASPSSGTPLADTWRCGRRHAVASRRQVSCT